MSRHASALQSAISNLQPGDLVKATASFTVSNSSSAALVIKNRLSAPAEIDLTGVKIVYTGTQQVNAVWLNNASNLYIFGGDISTSDTGGVCLRVYGSQHVLWWGFNLHDCGAHRLPGASHRRPRRPRRLPRHDLEGRPAPRLGPARRGRHRTPRRQPLGRQPDERVHQQPLRLLRP